jgi:hypothetical protein
VYTIEAEKGCDGGYELTLVGLNVVVLGILDT